MLKEQVLTAIKNTGNMKLAHKVERIIDAMSPSMRNQAESAIEGHLEKAAQKYYQIKLAPESTSVNHWKQGLKGILKRLVDSNKAKIKKGFFCNKEKLESLLNSVKTDALDLAKTHLNLKKGGITSISIEKLFEMANLIFPENWK